MKKRGFTLIELLVYMAIVGIVVVVAGQAFTNSTKMRVKTQGSMMANQIAEDVGSLLKDDLAQVGAKSTREQTIASGDDQFSSVYTDVYMDPDNEEMNLRDSSSFVLTTTNNFSDLKFRRIRYDEDGKYMSTEEVRWFVEDGSLQRSCWTVAKGAGVTLADNDPCAATSVDDAASTIIANDVDAFSVSAGKPTVSEEDIQLFPRSGNEFMLLPRFGEAHYNLLTVTNNGTTSELQGFASNFDMERNEANTVSTTEEVERNQVYVAEYESGISLSTTNWKTRCSQEGNFFTLEPRITYEISFELPKPLNAQNKIATFKPEQDFLAVGFRDNKGQAFSNLSDFPFYPTVLMEGSGGVTRSMRFAVSDTVKNACLVFSFASFSPATPEGALTISNLKLKRVATANYSFDSWNTETTSNIKEKKNVKAFKIVLAVKKNKEMGKIDLVIPAPSNGPRD